MKRFTILAAFVALVVAVCGVYAQSQIQTLPRLKWSRGISSYGAGVTDSTRISIPSPAAAGGTDATDTTAWFDCGQFKFAQDYAKQPLVLFQVNTQLSTTTDSVQYQLQYTNDLGTAANPARPLAVTAANLTTVAASTAGGSAGDDGLVGTIVVVSPDAATGQATGTAAALPFRYARLAITNIDATAPTGRKYFSVTPIVYGLR